MFRNIFLPRHLVLGGVLILFAAIPFLGRAAGDPPVGGPPPVPQKLPPGKLGEVVRLGRELVHHTRTHPLSREYVGNDLNCTSCHLDDGQHPRAATFRGLATAYPAFAPREGRVITLQDRILNCFMRSMNGTRPPLGSEAVVAIEAYIAWLSEGRPMQMNPKKPLGPHHVPDLKLKPEDADADRGAQLYAAHCADCHAVDGQGDESNPPVWGPRSYNNGAGLSQVPKLANWLKVAMPLDDPVLTKQQALDIAAYVNSHERPAFNINEHLPRPERLGEYNGRTD